MRYRLNRQQAAQAVEQFEKRDGPSSGHIVGVRPQHNSAGAYRGGHVGRDRVLDEGEIPALQPVTMDLRRPVVEQGVDEQRDYSSVRRIGTLPGPKTLKYRRATVSSR